MLYALAPPRTDRRGRPALKGTRLGTTKDLATVLARGGARGAARVTQ